MKFITENSQITGAVDHMCIYLTAAVVVWFVLSTFFNSVWPGGMTPVPENELRVKDMLNVLMYVIPVTLAGLAAGNVFVFLLSGIVMPLAEITVCGLSVLYNKITGRGESHE